MIVLPGAPAGRQAGEGAEGRAPRQPRFPSSFIRHLALPQLEPDLLRAGCLTQSEFACIWYLEPRDDNGSSLGMFLTHSCYTPLSCWLNP